MCLVPEATEPRSYCRAHALGLRVIAVVLILAVVGFDRLMASDRGRSFDPVRSRWRQARPRLIAHIRSAPGTFAYLFVLLVTTWVLQTSSATIARRLIAERSTNLHQLARDPLRVLFASAFWLTSPGELLLWLVLFGVIVAPVEQWIGTGRTALVFFVGHIGATLVTAGGLWLAIHSDLVEASVAHSTDVGASYGFAAVAAVLAYRLRGRTRRIYLGGAFVVAALSFAVDYGFTSWGHVSALLIGFACYPLVRGRHPALD